MHTVTTLYARLRDRLRTDILEGRLAARERLPSESALIDSEGVSRITVRQALNDLAKEGLIVKLPGKGSFVAPHRVSQDLSRLRGLAETVSGSGQTVHTRVLAWTELKATRALAAELAVAPGTELSALKTLRYLDREPFSLNRCTMARVLARRLSRLDLQSRDLLDIFESDCGIEIGHAALSIDAVAADRAHARHLKVPEGSPLLRVHRVTHAASGRPLHSETATHRSDRFGYELRVDRARPGA